MNKLNFLLVWMFGLTSMITAFASNPSKIVDNQCGSLLSDVDNNVYCYIISGASEYKFEIKSGSTIQFIEANTNKIKLTDLSGGAQYGRIYEVRVATKGEGDVDFGDFGDTCLLSTPAAPQLSIVSSQCNTTVTGLNKIIYCERNDNAEVYEFELTGGGQTFNHETTVNNFMLADVTGTLAGIQYNIRVRAKFNGVWASFGSVCSIITVPLTKLVNTQCGGNLATVNALLYCYIKPDVAQYTFEVSSDGESTRTFTSNTNKFSFSDLTGGGKFDKTYSVKVAIKTTGGVQGEFGEECNVITPMAPTTKILDTFCGKELHTINDYVYAERNDAIEEYRFEISNGGFNWTIEKPENKFQFSEVPGALIATTYTVRVASKIEGAWRNFGPSCEITAPIPLLNVIAPEGPYFDNRIFSLEEFIYSQENDDVEEYRFEISNGDFVQTIDKVSNKFQFSEVPGVEYAETYSVRVAPKYNGQWFNYNTPVTIHTPYITQLSLFCNNEIPTLNTVIYSYAVDTRGGTYTFEVDNGETVREIEKIQNRFSLTELFATDVSYGQTYKVRVKITDLNRIEGDWGPVCEVRTPEGTKIESQCGTTLEYVHSFIYAKAVSGASTYYFEVTEGDNVEVVTSNYFNYLDLTNLSNGVKYNTEYAIRVATDLTGANNFGESCTVTTPQGLQSKISVLCGQTIESFDTPIYSYFKDEALMYVFEVSDGETTEIINKNSQNWFRLSELNMPIKHNTDYSVRVKLFDVAGTDFGFGEPCTVTTPTLPTSKLVRSEGGIDLGDIDCGFELTDINKTLYLLEVFSAEKYTIEVTNPIGASATIEKSTPSFKLSDFGQTDFRGQFLVRVAVTVDGVMGDFGQSCPLDYNEPQYATSLVDANCGIEIGDSNRTLYCYKNLEAQAYIFEITNPLGAVSTIEKETNTIQLSELPHVIYNEEYSIRVAMKVNGEIHDFSKTCTVSLPVAPVSSIVQLQCGAGLLNDLNAGLYCYLKPDVTRYKFEVSDGEQTWTKVSLTNFIRLSDLGGDIEYDKTYDVRVSTSVINAGSLSDDGSFGEYGSVCKVASWNHSKSRIISTRCGGTVKMNEIIELDHVFEALKYQIELSNGDAVQYFESDTNSFKLSDFENIENNISYTVRVRVKHALGWGGFGETCTLMLEEQVALPLTKLVDSNCGITIDDTNRVLYCFRDDSTEGYRFKVSQGDRYQIIEKPSNKFTLSDLLPASETGLEEAVYGETYSIQAAGKYNGEWAPFGESCNVKLRDNPLTRILDSQCGGYAGHYVGGEFIYCYYQEGVSKYKFEVTYGESIMTIVSDHTSFSLYDLSQTVFGEISIRVATSLNGTNYGAYGESCIVITPELPTTKLVDSNCGIEFDDPNRYFYCYRDDSSEGYRFEVRFDDVVEEIETTTNKFRLTDVITPEKGKKYSIRAAGKYNGVYASYGEACNVIYSIAPITTISVTDCGLDQIKGFTSSVSCDVKEGVVQYKFEIKDGDKTEEIISDINSFLFTQLDWILEYNKLYSVRVATSIDGVEFGNYGDSCEISFDSSVQSSLDWDYNYRAFVGVDEELYVFPRGFELYRYEVKTSDGTIVIEDDKPYLQLLSLPAIKSNEQFEVRVGIFTEGGWSYGWTTNLRVRSSTNMVSNQCGEQLNSIDSFIYCYLKTELEGISPTIVGYQFEIDNGDFLETFTSDTNKFKLTDLVQGASYGTQYSVRAAVITSDYRVTHGPFGQWCQISTPPAPFVSRLVPSNCNSEISNMNSYLYCLRDENTDKYRFEISLGDETQIIEKETNKFMISELEDAQFDNTYNVRVSARYDGAWAPYGDACTVTTPEVPFVTKLVGNQCGKDITTLESYIYCLRNDSSERYRFEISNGDEIQVLEKDANKFTLSDLENIQSQTTYSVRAAAKFNGVWVPYGDSCEITTPTLTQVSVLCNQTLSELNKAIYSYRVEGTQEYIFEVTNGANSQEILRPTNWLRLTDLSGGALYSTAYSIRVALVDEATGTKGSFGPACTVMTPEAPLNSLLPQFCNSGTTDIDKVFYCYRDDSAEMYRFQLNRYGSWYTIEKETNSFKLSDFNAVYGSGTYSIRVSAKYNGFWAPYGEICSLTLVNPTKLTYSSCNRTLSTLSQTIYASQVTGAYEYIFEFNDGETVTTISTPNYYTSFLEAGVPENYNTQYTVRVAFRFTEDGPIQEFGDPCTVATPKGPKTQIVANQCGFTLTNVDDYIYCDPIDSAQEYRFSTYDSNTGMTKYFTSTENRFKISDFDIDFTANNYYYFSVSVLYDYGVQGDVGSSCSIRMPALPTTRLVDSNCNTYREADVDNWIYCYRDDSNEGYRFEVRNSATYQTTIIESEDNKFKLSEVEDIVPGANYTIRAAGKYNGVWAAYSTSCSIAIKGTTQIQSSQCNSALSSISNYIYCDRMSGVEKYKFEVSEGENTYSYETSSNYFRLSDVTSNTNFATYSIRVAVQYPNEDFGEYGDSCSISTPIEQTQIVSTVCNSTLDSPDSEIFCESVNQAVEYKFEVYSFSESRFYTYVSDTNSFRLSDIESLTVIPNRQFYVRVAIRYSTTDFGSYGNWCSIYTPSLPTTTLVASNCNSVRGSDVDHFVYCYRDDTTTGYRFEVRKNSNFQTAVIESDDNKFKLSEVGAIEAGEQYTIRAAGKYGETYADYGASCTISIRNTTQIQTTQCGTTLVNFTDRLYCNSVIGAERYKFAVYQDGVLIDEVESTSTSFVFSSAVNASAINTLYSIRVAVKYPNEDFGAYGESCQITSPSGFSSIGIIGSATPGGWSMDTDMQTTDGINYELVSYLTIGELKFRENNDWSNNWGSSGMSSTAIAGGANIAIPVAGEYIIRFNTTTLVYSVDSNLPNVAVIGTAVNGGWTEDVDMFSTDGVNYSIVITLQPGNLKFRQDDDWEVSWSPISDVLVGSVVEGGNDTLTIYEAAQYSISLNINTLMYSIVKYYPSIGIIGDSTAAGWTVDENMSTSDGINYSIQTTLIAGNLKFRQDDDWTINWSDYSFPEGTAVLGGDNIVIPEAGTYDISFNVVTLAFTFELVTSTRPAISETSEEQYEVKAFPNPFNDTFNISYPTDVEGEAIITIYDMSGRTVKTMVLNANSINETTFGQELGGGIYNVVIENGANVSTLRLVKH